MTPLKMLATLAQAENTKQRRAPTGALAAAVYGGLMAGWIHGPLYDELAAWAVLSLLVLLHLLTGLVIGRWWTLSIPLLTAVIRIPGSDNDPFIGPPEWIAMLVVMIILGMPVVALGVGLRWWLDRRGRRAWILSAVAVAAAFVGLGGVTAAAALARLDDATVAAELPTPEVTPTPPLSASERRELGGYGKLLLEASRGMGSFAESDVYVLNADGTGLRNLTPGPGSDRSPAWSPDGRRIVFVSERDGQTDLYVMTADGSDVMRLTNSPDAEEGPLWSPDGRRIAFVVDLPDPAWSHVAVYVMNSDGSGLRRLVDGAQAQLAWSPDGTKLALVADAKSDFAVLLSIVDVETGLAATLAALHSGQGLFRGMGWAPDGSSVAFCHGDIFAGPKSLSRIRPDRLGKKPRRIASCAFDVAWAPDSDSIAYVEDAGLGGTLKAIHTVSPDGSAPRRLVVGGHSPAWSPDGAKIAFIRRHEGEAADGAWRIEASDVCLVRRDGGGVRRIVRFPGVDIGAVAWQPQPQVATTSTSLSSTENAATTEAQG